MARGVRGSGTAGKRLSPDEARQERERLQAQLQKLEAQDAERYALIGRVVAHHAESDEGFAKQLRELLDRNVTDRGERMCVGLTVQRRGGRRSKAAGGEAGLAQPITAAASDVGSTDL